MRMITATATEMQNNFGHYLNFVMSVQESIVTKNGKEAGRFTSKEIGLGCFYFGKHANDSCKWWFIYDNY